MIFMRSLWDYLDSIAYNRLCFYDSAADIRFGGSHPSSFWVHSFFFGVFYFIFISICCVCPFDISRLWLLFVCGRRIIIFLRMADLIFVHVAKGQRQRVQLVGMVVFFFIFCFSIFRHFYGEIVTQSKNCDRPQKFHIAFCPNVDGFFCGQLVQSVQIGTDKCSR